MFRLEEVLGSGFDTDRPIETNFAGWIPTDGLGDILEFTVYLQPQNQCLWIAQSTLRKIDLE